MIILNNQTVAVLSHIIYRYKCSSRLTVKLLDLKIRMAGYDKNVVISSTKKNWSWP